MPRSTKTSSRDESKTAKSGRTAGRARPAPVEVDTDPDTATDPATDPATEVVDVSAVATNTVDAFVAAQRDALYAERGTYVRQADELKAAADSLALEHEPGDVQFDEEGGEGGTSNVDRELDLLLSAQARGAVDEIDRALAKIDAGTYGRCEQCGQPILEARLEALPHAALCVVCKSGGLTSRR